MRSAADMSDSELLAAIAMPALIEQESGGRAGVLGPQTRYGRAQGMTQMLPATAQATARKIGMEWRPELMTGTDQEAADYQRTLGEAYLREGIESTGSLEDGFRYYHGGPNRKLWGPKTEAYAQQVAGRMGRGGTTEAPSAVSQMSDEELLAALGEAGQRKPDAVSSDGSLEVFVGDGPAPKPMPKAVPKPASRLPQLPQRQGPTIAQDALSGALQPFQDVGHTFMEGMRSVEGGKPLDPFFIPKLLGGALAAVPTAAQMAVARPAARGINRGANAVGLAPNAFTWNPAAPFRKLEGDEAQRQTEGQIVAALSAGKPASGKLPAAPKGKAASVQDLQVAKTNAYTYAKSLGVAYDPKATGQLAGDITKDLASVRINPNITPKAHAAMQEVSDALSSGKPVDLTEMDQLRQMVQLATGKADDAEQFMGKRIIEAIDRFTDSAGPAQVVNGSGPEGAAAISAAREANKRFRKVQTVTNEVESAKLRASSTYAGGNEANAIRQELRPLIDPTSGKRIANLTPKETKALKKVVQGTGGANAWRVTGKTLDPRGLLGAALQTAMGIPSGGLSTASMPLGVLASTMSNRATNKAVADLLKVLAGPAPGAPKLGPIPNLPQLGPTTGMVNLLSPKGLAGVASIAGLPARIPSRPPEKTVASKAKGSRRK